MAMAAPSQGPMPHETRDGGRPDLQNPAGQKTRYRQTHLFDKTWRQTTVPRIAGLGRELAQSIGERSRAEPANRATRHSVIHAERQQRESHSADFSAFYTRWPERPSPELEQLSPQVPVYMKAEMHTA